MDRRQFLLAGSSLLAAAPFAPALAQAPVAARIGYIPVIGTAPIFVANGQAG